MLSDFYQLDILIRTFNIVFEFNIRYYVSRALAEMIEMEQVNLFLFQRFLRYDIIFSKTII